VKVIKVHIIRALTYVGAFLMFKTRRYNMATSVQITIIICLTIIILSIIPKRDKK